MASSSPLQNPFAAQWSAFTGAVNDPTVRATPGGVQMYVWQSIQNDYIARGASLPPNAFQAVNQLLSLAGEQRAKALALQRSDTLYQRTGLDQAVVAQNHIAPAIDSSLLGSTAGAQYRITYEAAALIDGQNVLLTLTHDAGFNLPQSMSALNFVIQDAANVRLADYGYEFTGEASVLSIQSY